MTWSRTFTLKNILCQASKFDLFLPIQYKSFVCCILWCVKCALFRCVKCTLWFIFVFHCTCTVEVQIKVSHSLEYHSTDCSAHCCVHLQINNSNYHMCCLFTDVTPPPPQSLQGEVGSCELIRAHMPLV